MGNPAAVPLSLLVIVVLDLLSLPVYNLISRHMEAEADWEALETTHDPRPQRAYPSFTIQSLNDPDPPTWSYLLFDSHPSVEQRIAMAEAWRPLSTLGQARTRGRSRLRAGSAGRPLRRSHRIGRSSTGSPRRARCRRRRGAHLVDLRGAHVHPRVGEVARDVRWIRMWFGWSSRVRLPERKTDESLSNVSLPSGAG